MALEILLTSVQLKHIITSSYSLKLCQSQTVDKAQQVSTNNAVARLTKGLNVDLSGHFGYIVNSCFPANLEEESSNEHIEQEPGHD